MNIAITVLLCVFFAILMFTFGYLVAMTIHKKDRSTTADMVEEKMMYMCGCRNCIEIVKMIISGNVKPIESQCSKCQICKDRGVVKTDSAQ